jgi:hemerythrin-like metal-binding protein
MDAIQEALTFFEQYTNTHFPNEEEQAKHITAPIAEKNRNEHQDFRSIISEIKAWIQDGSVSIVEVMSLKIEMEQWLINHISKTDVQLFASDK